MQKLIPLISDLQEIIVRSDLNIEMSLPMIVVVGSQSTGKSSLLQSIIGKQILPKGRGVVTRRPIQIQLVRIHESKEYAEFVDSKGEHYQDMEEFRKLIEAQTQKICGQKKCISSLPIRIRYYSKKVLDLLLVDLPGIVKNPTGDQPKDIEQLVIKMIKGYIRNPNCIIIAVSKATQDSANSESLKLAREVDRQGMRTIGVITQVDLVQRSLNILKDYTTLANNLSLGYVCVYLRGPKSTLTLDEHHNEQQQFFRKHEQYSHISQKMGVKSLMKVMNMVLIKHIKIQLPIIRQNIVYILQHKKNKIYQYGTYETITDTKAQGILVLSLISKYVRHFIQLIEGRHSDSRQAIIGGARIQYIFSQNFIKSINKMNPFQYLNDHDIRTAIKNANGIRKSLFLPEAAFQNLLRTQISRLKMPSLQCAYLIYEELRRLIGSIRIPQIQRFQILNKRILDVMQDLLNKSLLKTEEMIKNLIAIELGYINTNHPDFIDVISLVKQKDQKKQREQFNDSFDSARGELNAFSNQRSEQDTEPGRSNLFRFKKQDKVYQDNYETQHLLDSKLKKINQSNHKNNKEDKPIDRKKFQMESLFISAHQDLFPRYRLPVVPVSIKVSEMPKQREQTQTEMIKKLIVSYFNVVKKNINDSVPKTIVTFLVNHCKNTCQKILVNNLYVQKELQKLLHEQEETINQRNKLQKDIQLLKACLDSINSIDSNLTL